MPCDTIRTTTLDLNVADEGVLLRGLRATGWEVRTSDDMLNAYRRTTGDAFSVTHGQITVRAGREAIADEVKQAYAQEAVRTAAKKYGFTVKVDAKDAAHVTLSRRGF